jgi:beta-aspartyl-peptidase (threonine type)
MSKAQLFSMAIALILLMAAPWALLSGPVRADEGPIAIAIHGGAGTISRDEISPEVETAIRSQLQQAVEAGHAVLAEGGNSLDAVSVAIRLLEDAPQFNAGRGAVLTQEGRVEMDASIMDGATLAAGAVASVTGLRHPIDAARRVMTDSPHVMLIGEGAESFARQFELEFMDADWFITDFRREQLRRIQSGETAQLEHRAPWYSTVGAVAIDKDGNLAAGTSTGGMSNKRWGRVGDSPIIGAGTYANNQTCAVSATGHGEYFIRHVVAYDICARMAYTAQPLAQTATTVVNQVLKAAGGEGGVIAIDRFGRISMPFNTPGMYRAAIYRDGEREVSIYGDEGRDHNQTPSGH